MIRKFEMNKEIMLPLWDYSLSNEVKVKGFIRIWSAGMVPYLASWLTQLNSFKIIGESMYSSLALPSYPQLGDPNRGESWVQFVPAPAVCRTMPKILLKNLPEIPLKN